MKVYAHTKAAVGVEQWQLLEDHLDGVSSMAARFASLFHARQWGELAGRFHDYGKYKL